MSFNEQVRADYEGIRDALNAIVDDQKRWLKAACRELGIYAPRIEGRTKEPHSLLLKVLRRERENKPYGANPLLEMSDLAGVRADLVYAADVRRLVAKIRQSTDTFEPVADEDVDDKHSALGVNQIGYIGVHVDVVPLQRHGLDKTLGRCEIQIRTNAQGAWAMAAHELTYKAVVDLPGSDQRRMNRLCALLELFDEQVGIIREALTGAHGYPEAIIADSLLALRFRFTTAPYDQSLTAEIVSSISPASNAESAHNLVRELDAFADSHYDKLEHILTLTDPELASQPEALLIFFLLDADPFKAQDIWIEAQLPHRLLQDLADTWSVRLPPPQ